MFVIDGDHLKRWILSRWEEAGEQPQAVDILNQIDREGDWMHYAYKITIEVKEKRAQPKTIYCRNCKWWEDGTEICKVFSGIDTKCKTEPDGFCYLAERRAK